MNIKVNAKDREIRDGITLEDFLADSEISAENNLILLNGDALEKDAVSTYTLKDGDNLDILCFAGGG